MNARNDLSAGREGVLRRTLEVLGSAKYRCLETPRYSVFHLEAPDGADYSFSVWIYDSGEPQITADLLDNPDGLFWGQFFELLDYPSVESRNRAFCETLERVVTCRTRITQTKGWLFWDFHCDAGVGSAWFSVGGHSAGRWIRGIRDSGQKKTVYFSPAIRRSERAVEQGDEADER
jgi:hypothetical protein